MKRLHGGPRFRDERDVKLLRCLPVDEGEGTKLRWLSAGPCVAERREHKAVEVDARRDVAHRKIDVVEHSRILTARVTFPHARPSKRSIPDAVRSRRIIRRVRVLVLGGTGFIGSFAVKELMRRGHDVTVFHRHRGHTGLPRELDHIHDEFLNVPLHHDEFRRFAPEVVLDMVPYIDKHGHGVLHLRGIARRAVVITSADVYRAFARLWRSELGPPDPVPLTEESPLRARRAPDASNEDRGFDNVEVEQAVVIDPAFPITILRFPATHGPGDPQHRLARYLRPMVDDRPAIVLSETLAAWRWARGYVENVAVAIALAVADERATARTYNVAGIDALTEGEWVRQIAESLGWGGEIVVIPDDELPEPLRQPYDFTQHMELDTSAIRSELGFRETVDESEGLRRTIEWELKTLDEVPNLRLDYGAEDEALTARF